MDITSRLSGFLKTQENKQESNVTTSLETASPKEKITAAVNIAGAVHETIDNNTFTVTHESEDNFFSTPNGSHTITDRYDLEKAIPNHKKKHFVEIDRYWVNKPFAFIILVKSTQENEVKYYTVEPFLNPEEQNLLEFLKEKVKDTLKYSEQATKSGQTTPERAAHVEEEAYKLLLRYGLISDIPYNPIEKESTNQNNFRIKQFASRFTSSTDKKDSAPSKDTDTLQTPMESIVGEYGDVPGPDGQSDADTPTNVYMEPEDVPEIDISSRPIKEVINATVSQLTDYQAIKLLYYVKRDSVMYGKIDPIKHDIQVEDISCDGYNSRVWVYHEQHEQIITNVTHGESDLDDFVINLAQRAGQGISKRNPQVDITLPDGSRGQLTLGNEVSDHGSNYTIRQFKDVPFTPVDLVNWKTFAPKQIAFLWLAIENHKSMIFAGGTASGKTTSLNAVSLFIPSNTKIVSIEDTREVELPQRNWVASVTRPSFTEDGSGEVDEFSLLRAALRQRPDYIIMGEIRGEEGRTLFQVMSTGHTTYTTFHADSVGEVIKRFTTDPINVSKTLFTSLDLISIQSTARVDGNKVRRNKTLTEVNKYNSETDEISVNDIYQWDADTDSFEQTEYSQILEEIKFDRGWNDDELSQELRKRETILAYLISTHTNSYTEVAATIQAFINDPDMVLDLIANEMLQENLNNLREMESVTIDINPEKEALVPRPEPPQEIKQWATDVLEREQTGLLQNRRNISDSTAISEILDTTESQTQSQQPLDTDSTKNESNEETTPQEVIDGFVVDRAENTADTADDSQSLTDDSTEDTQNNKNADFSLESSQSRRERENAEELSSEDVTREDDPDFDAFSESGSWEIDDSESLDDRNSSEDGGDQHE